MRWIWIDRFIEFESGVRAVAVKSLSFAEDHFRDHFPGYPVMPATLMLEGLAQTGGILVGEARQFREKVVLAKIPKAQFWGEVSPGEQLTYTTRVLDLRDEGALVAGQIHVGTRLLGEAEIFFAHLDRNQAQMSFGDDNFVFSGELTYLLGQAKLAAKQLPPAPAPG